MGSDFAWRLMWLPLSILSLTVHEFAHAWSAWRLGDDTAARQGRMTLNPLAHIDPLGTLILPLLGIPFGWAKPVPVSPVRFTRSVTMGQGMAITAAAGPVSNLVLAALSAVLLGLALRLAPELVAYDTPGRFALVNLVRLNVGLAIFNLLPVPPLDGSRIVAWLLPTRLQARWHELERLAPILLIGVFYYGGRLVQGPVGALASLLFSITRAIA